MKTTPFPVRSAAAVAGVLAVLLGGTAGTARVKLATLPDRESISLSIEHPQRTLMQEERTLTLQEGLNRIDFSWQGVRIDASAIVLEMLDHPDKVKLIAVRYPPGEDALVWDVASPGAMTERVRVTYFLEGIERDYAYRVLADKDEKNLEMKSYVRLRNNSGERLEDARVHTGLGSSYVTDLDPEEMRETLSGRIRLPLERKFTWDSREKPHDPVLEKVAVGIPITYVIPNTTEVGLGKAAIRYGKARVFQEDRDKSSAFLGEDWAAYTPVLEKLNVKVGESRDLRVTRKQMKTERPRDRRNSRNQVILYDERTEYELIVENFRKTEATASIVDHFDESWSVTSSSHPYEKFDSKTLKFEVPVAAGDSETVKFTIERRNIRPNGMLR